MLSGGFLVGGVVCLVINSASFWCCLLGFKYVLKCFKDLKAF